MQGFELDFSDLFCDYTTAANLITEDSPLGSLELANLKYEYPTALACIARSLKLNNNLSNHSFMAPA
jgi:hypothetical protein